MRETKNVFDKNDYPDLKYENQENLFSLKRKRVLCTITPTPKYPELKERKNVKVRNTVAIGITQTFKKPQKGFWKEYLKLLGNRQKARCRLRLPVFVHLILLCVSTVQQLSRFLYCNALSFIFKFHQIKKKTLLSLQMPKTHHTKIIMH